MQIILLYCYLVISVMTLFDLFLGKIEIQLVNIVEGHLMPVTTEDNQLFV